jgi:hypothetical protein
VRSHLTRRGRLSCVSSPAWAESVGHDLSESRAHAVLERACGLAGLSADAARLLRIGSNAVYHLAAPVVVRISRKDADFERARRTVAVARWLASGFRLTMVRA